MRRQNAILSHGGQRSHVKFAGPERGQVRQVAPHVRLARFLRVQRSTEVSVVPEPGGVGR